MIPKHENSDGLVGMAIGKKASEVEAGRAQLVTSLQGVLGNKPGVSLSVETIKETGDSCEVILTVRETNNGQSRKIPSQDLSNFFTGQAAALKNFGVTNVYAKIGFSKSDLDDYLSKPPSGVDARLWPITPTPQSSSLCLSLGSSHSRPGSQLRTVRTRPRPGDSTPSPRRSTASRRSRRTPWPRSLRPSGSRVSWRTACSGSW